MTPLWLLRLMKGIPRALCNCLRSILNHNILAIVMLKLLLILLIIDYNYLYNGCDLLYWREQLRTAPLQYVLSIVVLMVSLHVALSSIESCIYDVLRRRQQQRESKPRQYFEERYRRFVLMRLVQALETALDKQEHWQHICDWEQLCMCQQQIHEALADFRSSVALLLWPNRADLQTEPSILYNVDDQELQALQQAGYSLNQPQLADISNEHLQRLLNPSGY